MSAQNEMKTALTCLFVATEFDVAEFVREKVLAAMAEKDKEITELRNTIGTAYITALVIKHEQRLVEARRLIEQSINPHFKYTNVRLAAQKWLEGTP